MTCNLANTDVEQYKTLVQFDPGQAETFGTGLVNFRHNFLESGLFTDDQLAQLIDRYPREYYMLTTVCNLGPNPEWRNGAFNGASGKEVLEALKTGCFWLSLRRLDLIAPEYDALVTDAFKEAEALNPNLKTSKWSSSILISSPRARVLYHADIPMVALWHLRGRKRLWLYDAENKTQLPDKTLEGIVLRETEEEIHYDPAWDDEATYIDMEPGTVLSWPHNAPHRVDNLDGLNVSITTDYFTPASLRKYGVYYTNGIMRRRFGWQPRSTASNGIMGLGKCAAAYAMKKANLHKQTERTMLQTFKLDRMNLSTPLDLQKHEWQPIVQA